ncbi:unnamed protein product [Phytophthora lilii]|uniref:Unnamed protein product n=1 Tax=Phytophthora lilii TaxID=2077276 RepID=A0A9W6XMT7_9STRA|nr:unnamed protein product [Phytophthora lilii]
MKRAPDFSANSDTASVSDDWCSEAASVLESYSDDTRDEMRDLSLPPTQRQSSNQFEARVIPIDTISRGSPVKSMSCQLEAQYQRIDGGIIAISGEDQESWAPACGGGAGFGFPAGKSGRPTTSKEQRLHASSETETTRRTQQHEGDRR